MSENRVTWTKQQQQVIESRGNNLLVSAAAGSGKTAVLVERIIRMVTDRDHPVDIDHLLVMTFTNAAASEMRERIGAAIEAELTRSPENEHLQVQATLVHHAQIMTIDSFCLNVIREHFNLLDLDPAFRIGDEGELLLLRGEVMEELIEEQYGSGGDRFLHFVETYAQGKNDKGIEDYILQVYTFAQSNPYPDRWFAACRQEVAEGQRSLSPGLPWLDFLVQDLKKQAGELVQQLEEAAEVCREDELLAAYLPMLTQDIRQLKALAEAEDFSGLYERLNVIAWDRLATVRSKEVDPERKTFVTGVRDRVKKAVGKMRELYCFAEPEEMETDMEGTREAVSVLLDLAEEFSERYQEKKRDKNLVDFNDLEHEALKVLIRHEGDQVVYTEAADELSSRYEEVLVDEYQDSNLVQEALLHAVSGERFGRYNLFMVGDVKQSIYRFRLARPELFLEKYHSYEDYEGSEGKERKIELHQNFRSREGVLSAVNDIFYKIMTENLGNIRYTGETALHPGAVFPVPEELAESSDAAEMVEAAGAAKAADTSGLSETPLSDRLAGHPQLLLVDTGEAGLAGLEEDAADFTAKELEGRLIAGKIRELTHPETGMLVWDKNRRAYRVAQYRDIVILLRSTAGWTENLLTVLMNEGIPAYAESRVGYFNTLEVETVLSFLSVIDNPMQDISLAAVLKSPIAGVTDEELAEMMAAWKKTLEKGQDRGIYAASRYYADEGEMQGLRKKLLRFQELLREFRRKSTWLPIHELIYEIYEKTGYYDYVSAMAAGETRRANLDMLVEKAADYEKTSYKGLFHFVRYIENLKRYNTDFGEASTLGEEDDTVRIMSIHKSKGLEFPIVFLAGMGKRFNRQDTYAKVLIDPELGIATDYLDTERRLKAPTLKKQALRRKMELDSLGEELRVLYVALTRAKEQLYMTGTDRNLAKLLEKYARIPTVNGQIPYTILSTAASCLDWVLMSLGCGMVGLEVCQIPLSELMGEEVEKQFRKNQSRDYLLNLDPEREYDHDFHESLQEMLAFSYPCQADTRLYMKLSVSELKHQAAFEKEPDTEETAQTQARQMFAFEDGKGGALRGTAFHRALELLDFNGARSLGEMEAELSDLMKNGRLSRAYYELLDAAILQTFLQSELGERMGRAQVAGRLHREQQFVLGLPARELKAADSGELVVIQGIIDAWFEEEDGLVLVDYKTDRVGSLQVLVDRYQAQLDYYEKALTRITEKPVKEKIIYSLHLQRQISL